MLHKHTPLPWRLGRVMSSPRERGVIPRLFHERGGAGDACVSRGVWGHFVPPPYKDRSHFLSIEDDRHNIL
jgi:hypothetical protein